MGAAETTKAASESDPPSLAMAPPVTATMVVGEYQVPMDNGTALPNSQLSRQPSPIAATATVSEPTHTAMSRDHPSRRCRQSARSPMRISPITGRAISATGLMPTANVTSSTASQGRRRSAASTPAAMKASISASLCIETTKLSSMMGHAATAHRVFTGS